MRWRLELQVQVKHIHHQMVQWKFLSPLAASVQVQVPDRLMDFWWEIIVFDENGSTKGVTSMLFEEEKGICANW